MSARGTAKDARIDSLLSAALAAGFVPNIVVMVADRAGGRCAGAAGQRIAGDADSGNVGPSSLYRLGSMT